ncbi:MAG: MFS transporter [Sulfolobaceae archaeon]
MDKNRFIVIGISVMLFNSLYQYSWNAFLPLLENGLDVDFVKIQVGYTLFNIFSTISQMIGGSIADKYGPRLIGIIASILSAIGFLGTSLIPNLFSFYIFWSLGSIGEGILYGIATNLAIKWFIDKRGFVVGIVSLGFGLGATIANPILSLFVDHKLPFLVIGLIEIFILPVLMYFSEYPAANTKGSSPKQLVSDKFWWLVYFSFTFSLVPLMIMSSSLTKIASYLPKEIVVWLISLFPLLSGIGRPALGRISDILGETKMILTTNLLLVIANVLLIFKLYIFSVLMIGLFGGSLITLYFSFLGEIYGIKYSTTNTGILYTGKAISGFLGSVIFSYLYLYNQMLGISFSLICSVIGLILILIFSKKKLRI